MLCGSPYIVLSQTTVSKIGNCCVIQHEKDVGGGCVQIYPTVLYLASGFCIMIQLPPGAPEYPLRVISKFVRK
jgi:hypothetical protein